MLSIRFEWPLAVYTPSDIHRRKHRRWDPARSTLDPRHTRWSERGVGTGCLCNHNTKGRKSFKEPIWEKSWDRERPAASKSDHLMSGRRNEPIDHSEQLRNTPQHRWFLAQGQDTARYLILLLLQKSDRQNTKKPREFAAEQQDSAGFMDVLRPENGYFR